VIPSRGLSFTLSQTKTGAQTHFYYDSSAFDLIPPLFFHDKMDIYDSMLVSGVFFLSEPAKASLFYAGHGEAVWKIDGTEFARHSAEASNRYLLIEKDISAGYHSLECSFHYNSPMPSISFSAENTSSSVFHAVSGPFNSGTVFPPGWLLIFRTIPIMLLIFSFLLFSSFLDRAAFKLFSYIFKHWKFFIFIGWISSLTFFFFLHFYFQKDFLHQFESDEAAFGLMSQALLDGQCPPLFHYGQNYQGTLEAYPLSLILTYTPYPSIALRCLPWIWAILFIVITTCILWFYGNSFWGLFSLGIFAVGGLHFHWIVGKNWFGYSFSLFCGAVLILLAYLALQKGRIPPGLAISWGMFAGLSLYELPLSLPFVISSGLILLFIRPFSFLPDFDKNESRFLYLFRGFFGFFRSGIFWAFFSCFLFCAPYWLPLFLGHNAEAIHFLSKGRSLPAARIAGEHPLIDRFLGECMPVFWGQRAPYDQQHDLHGVFFPNAPTLIFLSSFLLYPFLRRLAPAESIVSRQTAYYSIWILALTTIILTSFSSFGVWPWYALPLYFSAPFLLFQLFRFLWSLSPALSTAAFLIYFSSILSAYSSYSVYFNQPASLSHDGLYVPTNFDKILSFLNERRICYLVCDQGFDVSPNNAGRDWVGEAITFVSQGRIIAIDSLNRRFPAKAQEIMKRSRVGYLFHEGYFYDNPSLDLSSDALNNYSPLSIYNLNRLFSSEFADYYRFDFPPYALFLPSQEVMDGYKSAWRFDSSVNWFFSAVNDHTLGVRSYGRDAYWSNGKIDDNGDYFDIFFDAIKDIHKIILFHGTKTSDFPRNNRVCGFDSAGEKVDLGSLQVDEEARCSILRLAPPMKLKGIKITIPVGNGGHWWTIVEAWVF